MLLFHIEWYVMENVWRAAADYGNNNEVIKHAYKHSLNYESAVSRQSRRNLIRILHESEILLENIRYTNEIVNRLYFISLKTINDLLTVIEYTDTFSINQNCSRNSKHFPRIEWKNIPLHCTSFGQKKIVLCSRNGRFRLEKQ